jgi:hypothetical protein
MQAPVVSQFEIEGGVGIRLDDRIAGSADAIARFARCASLRFVSFDFKRVRVHGEPFKPLCGGGARGRWDLRPSAPPR